MKYTEFYDLHTHSEHSFDGNHSCEHMCISAIDLGLNGIAITDHCEIDGIDIDFDNLCGNQFFDTAKCEEMFKNELRVIKGIELGQAIYNKPIAEKILDKYDYDFVLGSIHNLENMEDFYYLNYNDFDVYSLLDAYFDTVQKLCDWNKFDSLAHLTYPLRYITGKYGINIDLNRFSAKIDNILNTLISNEKALEINTSGFHKNMPEILPGKDILKRFKKLGGKFITIGSDSHYSDKIGVGIECAMAAAEEAGFEYFTIFVGRKPKLIEIKKKG